MHNRLHDANNKKLYLHKDKHEYTISLQQGSNNTNNRDDEYDDKKKHAKSFTSIPKPMVMISLLLFVIVSLGEYIYYHSTKKPNPQVQGESNSNYVRIDAPTSKKEISQNNQQQAAPIQNAELAEESEEDVDSEPEPEYHIVFSTDCSSYQHWQSYLLFYSAMKVQQKGYIVRIASGCTPEEQTSEQEWHTKHIINKLSSKFLIHFTPKFSNFKKSDGSEEEGDYKFFNKPFGLRHWFEHGVDMGILDDKKKERDIVVLLDPDMIFLRPMTHDFSNRSQFIMMGPHLPVLENGGDNQIWKVQHGIPFAQMYGYGLQWQSKIDLDAVTNSKDSPAKDVPAKDAKRYYPIGPPALVTAKDMYQITIKWTEFAPGVHKQYPYLLAEMFAYSISAAHLELPHQIVESLMVSDTTIVNKEGWKFIDDIEDADICNPLPELYQKYPLPIVFHYCQRYLLKDWLFAKRRKELQDMFTCQSPLLMEPINGDWILELKDVDYKYKTPDTKETSHFPKRELFALCQLTKLVNEASVFFKQDCDNGGNLEKEVNLWKKYHHIEE